MNEDKGKQRTVVAYKMENLSYTTHDTSPHRSSLSPFCNQVWNHCFMHQCVTELLSVVRFSNIVHKQYFTEALKFYSVSVLFCHNHMNMYYQTELTQKYKDEGNNL
jgi:hypothetical protein